MDKKLTSKLNELFEGKVTPDKVDKAAKKIADDFSKSKKLSTTETILLTTIIKKHILNLL